MEIRQLSYFVAVAQCGSFSAASRQACLSQSAMSQQIRALEEELGTSLFVRNSHRVELTESGEALLPLARRAIGAVQECQHRMRDLSGMLCGEVSIGLTHSMEPYVRRAMVQYMRRYPGVRLSVNYRTIPELMEMLHERRVDVALCLHVEGEEEWTECEELMQMRHCAVMRDTHPLAGRQELSLCDLEHQSLILPERDYRTCSAVEHYLLHDGADGGGGRSLGQLRVRATVNDPTCLLHLLRETNGISILSERSAKELPGLCAVRVHELSAPATVYAHYLRGVYRRHSVQVFMEMLREQIGLYS